MAFIPKSDINEEKAALSAMRRRKLEDERKQRFFNAKTRIIGIDVVGLEKQIEERKRSRQQELDCMKRYEENVSLINSVVYGSMKDEEKRKRQQQKDLIEYRRNFQKYEDRLEFDINDPNYVRHQIPTRIADDDMRLGVSSLQILSGEDIDSKERKKIQMHKQRDWLDKQLKERQQDLSSIDTANKMLADALNVGDRRLVVKNVRDNKVRKDIDLNCAAYNRTMALNKADEREKEKREEDMDNKAEIFNMLTSDMLTENPDVAQSRLHPNKKIAFMYRGMTNDEAKLFRNDQERHRLELKRLREDKKKCEKEFEKQILNWNDMLKNKDHELSMGRKKILDALKEEQQNLAKLAKARKELELSELKNTYISDEFYANFNKTIR